MARRAGAENTFTKGVLDPDLSERNDLKHRYDSLQSATNLEVTPQGGLRRRMTTRVNDDADVISGGYLRRTRRQLMPVVLSASMLTMHNGGSAAHLLDQDPRTVSTTSPVPDNNTFVLVEADLGNETDICCVDVQGFYSETAADDALALEYWTGSAWAELQGPIESGASRRNVRPRGSTPSVAVNVATTTHIPLKGTPVVDDVQVGIGWTVLVKNHADPGKNGLYTTAALDWTRHTSADSAAEIFGASYFISGGAINGGTTWINTNAELAELNSLATNESAISYALAPAAGRTRRFSSWPGGPGGEPVSSRYWRLVVKEAAAAGAVSIAGLRFWRERAAASASRVFAVDRSLSAIYDLVLSDRNIDVFKRGSSGARRYVASIPVPIGAHQVAEVTMIAQSDTVLFFHEDIATVRIVRQGSDYEWNADTLPVYNVPRLKAGAAFAGNQDEIQQLAFYDIVPGKKFCLALGGLITEPITYASSSALSLQIASALAALPGMAAAPTVKLQSAALPAVRVTFSGANGSRAWPALQILPLEAAATWTPAHLIVQQGLSLSGPFFGDKTGWPRCGCFAQGRLLLGGFRAAPRSWAASEVDSFSFRDDPGPADESVDGAIAPPLTADMAFVRTLESDQLETIQQVYVGRHLQFFTDSSEWFVESRTLDATQPANAVRATGSGIKSSVRASFAEGATIVVQQGGRTIRDFLYSDVEQSYTADPLTLLAPHLLTNVVDLAYRKAQGTEANLIVFLNDDGSAVALSLLRKQEVVGMVPWTTDGLFRSVCAHVNSDVAMLIERNGDHYLEMLVRDVAPLDAMCLRTYTSPVTVIDRLEHLEGRAVWAYAGSELCGPFTVANGRITLAAADAATVVKVGAFPAVYGALHPVREKVTEAQPFRPPGRIYELGLALKETGHIEVRANGGQWRDVALAWHDGAPLQAGQIQQSGAPDEPMLNRLLTGTVRVENLRGWTAYPQVEFRQSVPAPLHIKAIRYEISMKG